MRRTGRVLAVGALTLGLAVILAPAAHADGDANPDQQGNLTVQVTDGTSTGGGTSGSSSGGSSAGGAGGSSSGGSSSGGSSSGGSGGAGGAGGAPSGGTGTGGAESGILSVGGLNAIGAISIDPFEGTVRVWFTVHNASASTFDATARLWMDTWLFGIPLDDVTVPVSAIGPGESRVVTADLHGAGQWTLLNVHATLTPPSEVGGRPAAPVTRDALVFVLPWLILAAAAVSLLGLLVYRMIRSAALLAAATGATP